MDKVVWSSESTNWGTPPELYLPLDMKYTFTLDPASSDENALTEYHFTEDDDGLSQPWYGQRVFLNPPYGREIKTWVEKSARESRQALIVALLPVRTGSRWWREWVMPYADIEFLPGRVKFVGATNSAPFDSAIARYR